MATYTDNNQLYKIQYQDNIVINDYIVKSSASDIPYRTTIKSCDLDKIYIEPELIAPNMYCIIYLEDINIREVSIYPKTQHLVIEIKNCKIENLSIHNVSVKDAHHFSLAIFDTDISACYINEIIMSSFNTKNVRFTTSLAFDDFSTINNSEIVNTYVALFDCFNSDFLKFKFSFFKIDSDVLLSSSSKVLCKPLAFLLNFKKYEYLKSSKVNFATRFRQAIFDTLQEGKNDYKIYDHIETISKFDKTIDEHFPHYKQQFDLEKKYCELQYAITRHDITKIVLLFFHLIISNFSFSPLRAFLWIIFFLFLFPCIYLLQGFYISGQNEQYILYAINIREGSLYTPDFLAAFRLTLNTVAMKSSNIIPRDTPLNTFILALSVSLFPTLLAMLILAIKRVTKLHS